PPPFPLHAGNLDMKDTAQALQIRLNFVFEDPRDAARLIGHSFKPVGTDPDLDVVVKTSNHRSVSRLGRDFGTSSASMFAETGTAGRPSHSSDRTPAPLWRAEPHRSSARAEPDHPQTS